MTNYKEILRLHYAGISQRSIASSCSCSRNTVASTLSRAESANLTPETFKQLSDNELHALLFPESKHQPDRRLPDYDYVHKELAKSGVTLSLLWNEYCQQCRLNQEIPYMYTQFCKHYREYAINTKATMHIDNKPGEKMEVDWAGNTAYIIDNITGEMIPAYIFVATLPCSQFSYVEAFLSMNQESWISAHANAYSYFGGVTRLLIPDNLKVGVIKTDWYTPVINKSYHEMAEYYETAIVPCRVRAPKDKASVEGTVGKISTWIIAALRNQQFFSLKELNKTIKRRLDEFNNKPFQKKPGSRFSVFMEQEKTFLQPLPSTPYELAIWKLATVQLNYCVAVEKMYYSVPYEYIKHQVDVRITKTVIEIFFKGTRICSHPRLYGYPGQYSMNQDHMPEKHRQYGEWNSQRFINWAERIGESTAIVIKALLTSHRAEPQAYKSCMALLKLSDKYSVERLESACKKALTYTPKPSYRSIQTILKTGQDRQTCESTDTPQKKDQNQYGFVRGAEYYGGKYND